jgi:hypothetical protein
MGGVEIAYQWRPGTAASRPGLVAIPNAGPPLDWDRISIACMRRLRRREGASDVDPALLTPREPARSPSRRARRGVARCSSAAAGARPPAHEAAAAYDRPPSRR